MATLDDVPFLQRPIGQMRIVGRDELGNPVYQNALTGARYMITQNALAAPSRDVGATPYGQPTDRRIVNWTPDLSRNALRRIGQALTQGITAPGRAARGEPVTYGDVYATALDFGIGAAPMRAPQGALRSGAMGGTSPAQDVADMLRTGRAADVTDEMMAAVDPQEMYRLYESGATGMDMPMDAASRMERADGMGFSGDFYKGAGEDYTQLRVGDSGSMGSASYVSPYSEVANKYQDGVVSPLSVRGNIEEMPRLGYGEASDAAREAGASGASRDWDVAVFNPANIRSRFARFDPRLSHLANLSAGAAGAAYISQDESNALRAYLQGGGT